VQLFSVALFASVYALASAGEADFNQLHHVKSFMLKQTLKKNTQVL